MFRILFNRASRNHRLMKSQSADNIKQRLRSTVFSLGAVCGLHTAAMMAFEQKSLGDAAWLTLTTATTVGYGDMSAATTLGRLSTVAFMYVAGITLLAQAASLYMDMRQDKRERILNGKWRWKMDNHIVIFNAPKTEPQTYFSRLMKQFRSSAQPMAQKEVAIISPNFTDRLSDDLVSQKVFHVNYGVTDPAAYENSSLDKAAVVIVLSRDENDPNSDSVTFDLVSRAREANENAVIIAEAVEDENRARLKKMGANHVIRPVRGYPGMLARAILSPGAEQVFEDLLDSEGEELVRYDFPVKGTWGDVMIDCIRAGLGAPVSYIDMEGNAISNAAHTDTIEGKGVMVVAREGNIKTDREIGKLFPANSNEQKVVAAATPTIGQP